MSDYEFQILQIALLNNPKSGDVMLRTGGFRKMRWINTVTGKGKRGGLRIIYYYLESDQLIWFFTIYAKNEMNDLTEEDRKILKLAIQTELNARRNEL